jgi:formylglycine-generating enzyme required for sulfatase activity
MIMGPDGQRRAAPFGTAPRFAAFDVTKAPLDHPMPEYPIKFPRTGLELVWIPEGNNAVGVPAMAEGPAPNEFPVTDVYFTRGFWLGKYEVTRGQFTNVMGSNPSSMHLGADYPVTSVTWDEAMEFCRKLNEREHAAERLPYDLEFTLPTEAQWEYAAKCGFVGPFGSHDSPEGAAWGSWSKIESPQPVGKREPNGWGLYDMFGNVGELCRDWYADRRPGGRVEDYPGPTSGTQRLYKGGSYKDSSFMMRASVRTAIAPDARDPRVGFRLALVLRGGEK